MILSVELSTNLISRVCSSSHVNLISLGDVSALLRSGSGIGEPEITCLITPKLHLILLCFECLFLPPRADPIMAARSGTMVRIVPSAISSEPRL